MRRLSIVFSIRSVAVWFFVREFILAIYRRCGFNGVFIGEREVKP